jgi:hypothetical protein
MILRTSPRELNQTWETENVSRKFLTSERTAQGCQIFLGPNIPKWEKYTKRPQTLPNVPKLFGHNLVQMVIKYTNTFHSKYLQNLPKSGFLVSKQTIWQPWDSGDKKNCHQPSTRSAKPRANNILLKNLFS